MKRGILGLGKESTAYYIHQIHHQYHLERDGYSTCPFLLYQIDFQEINPFLPNNFSTLIPKMEVCLRQISELGITKLLVPNITLHETLDQMVIPLQLCHPVTLTLEYLNQNSISAVYLFGTKYTMNSGCIHQKFEENGIKIKSPTEADQMWLDDFRKTVYEMRQTAESISIFQNMIKTYGKHLPVVIACTELSIFSLKENPFCIDMMDLQIEDFFR